ncbi:MAG: hypothetical protein K2K21_03485 [Lachnospiraceae bacterium]|nr:hypothetical protein [Lachnospiraceae bacterium]
MSKYDKNPSKAEKSTKGNGDKMPTVEKIYCEMTDYLRDLEAYVENYKNLSKEEAKKQAKETLVGIGIIDEQGNLTGFYKNT